MKSPNDQNNLMFAIALSIAVLMGWQYFFARPQIQHEQARQEFTKKLEAQRNGTSSSEAPPSVANAPVASPSADVPAAGQQAATATPQSRDETLKASPRIEIVTPSLEGSIALKSGRIDDLVLSKYRETVDPNSAKVTLLSPAGSPEAYFTEFGWVPQGGSHVKVPDRDSLWSLESGKVLTPDTPVTLAWDNGQGLVFHRNISVDKDYMFKVVDEVENKTSEDVTLLPYARVHRSGHPASQPFYLLHEGLIGVSGEHGLQEITYADAIKSGVPKTIENVTGGWLGITDKYWATALVPDQKAAYRAMYSALKGGDASNKDAFQADYLRRRSRGSAGRAQKCRSPSLCRRQAADADRRL